MRKIFSYFLLSSIIFNLVSSAEIVQQQTGTRVVFYVEHKVEQPNDYVQLSIEIKSQQPSLDQAITQAKQIVQKVETIVKNYCKQHSKGKNDCDGVVETTKYQINPIYQLVRKVPTFVAFSVKHETIAKIKYVRDIGKLADDILKSKVSKINSFEWKPLKQIDIEEQTVSEGMEIVNSICDRIGGMKLDRIIQVSEVSDYEQDDKKQKQEQSKQQQEKSKQQQKEQEENKVVYKFSIICGEKKKQKKENK